MKVFCPNCGHAHEATAPGARMMCTACGGTFDAPGRPASAPAATAPPPAAPSVPTASPSWPSSAPPSPYGVAPKTSPLAIISLVAGILCCIPFASIGAVVTGIIAIKQIDEKPTELTGKGMAIAGIILGGLGILSSIMAIIAQVLQR